MRKRNLEWVVEVMKRNKKVLKPDLIKVIIGNLSVRKETAEDYINTLVQAGKLKNKYGMIFYEEGKEVL